MTKSPAEPASGSGEAPSALPECLICAQPTTRRMVGICELAVCPNCGMGRTLGGQQGPDYWSRTDDSEGQLAERYWTSSRRRVFAGALRVLAAGQRPGRLADLGGGVGYFARCALDQGWDAYSIDVSDLAVAAAGARIGPQRSFASPPADLLGTCDVVTLWCVVAHVDDPRPILDQALALLKPGGRLFITTPNLAFQMRYVALLARLGRPVDFLEHDHLLHYTSAALKAVLGHAGVDQVTYTYAGVHEDCVAHRGLAPVVVPLKRIWNQVAVAAHRAGLPLWSSELQAVGIKR